MYGEQMVKSGDSAIAPPVVRERYGYTFTGWDKSFVNVQGSLDVYAVYEPNTYILTFDANADTYLTVDPDPKSMNVIFDSAYGPLATVNRDHYTFDGWFTEPVNGVEVTPATVLKLAENHTLYAHWTPKVYTITYELDGDELYPTDSPPPTNPASYTVESTFPISLNEPTKFAYDFQGWTITYANETTEMLPPEGIIDGTTGNIILTALWTPAKYAIHYDLDVGGENDPNNPHLYTVEDFPISPIIDPTNEFDYLFLGWIVNCANGSIVPGLKFNYVIPEGTTGDLTLYAQWVQMGGVSKTVADGFAFNVDSQLSYDISYAYIIPDDTDLVTRFEIVDSCLPIDSIEYLHYILRIDGKMAFPKEILLGAAGGNVTFVIDPADLVERKLLTLTVTFTVKDTTQGISNNVHVFVNDNLDIGEAEATLCLISYNDNWPVVGGSGNVPTSYLYAIDSVVAVAGNAGGLAVDDWVFIGWSMDIDGSVVCLLRVIALQLLRIQCCTRSGCLLAV